MMKKVLCLSLILAAWSLAGERFEWNLHKDMTVNLEHSGSVEQTVNNLPHSKRDELNIVNLTITGLDDKGAHFKGTFKTFYTFKKGSVPQLHKTFTNCVFHMSNSGIYTVSDRMIQPTVRSIPTFPDRELSPGDKWVADAEFYYYELDPPFFITTPVTYRYLSNTIYDKKDTAVIHIAYSINENANTQLGTYKPNQIAQVFGESRGLLYWDIKDNVPMKLTEKFSEFLIQNSRDQWNMLRDFVTIYKITYPIKKRKLAKIEKKIEKELKEIPGVKTFVDKRGINIDLGDILFDYDKSDINLGARRLLKKIIPSLKKYVKNEIMIEGHTDNIGSDGYNQKLSEARAHSVGSFIKDKIPELGNRLYYKGYGSSRPVSSNRDEEGRKQNRRVVILIKQSGE